MTTQLYAKIKKSSKYYRQNQSVIDNCYGLPFPVEVRSDGKDGGGHVIKGGPGAAKDVNLYAIVDGRDGGFVEIKLS